MGDPARRRTERASKVPSLILEKARARSQLLKRFESLAFILTNSHTLL